MPHSISLKCNGFFGVFSQKNKKTPFLCQKIIQNPVYRFFSNIAQIDRWVLNFKSSFMQKVPPKPPSWRKSAKTKNAQIKSKIDIITNLRMNEGSKPHESNI